MINETNIQAKSLLARLLAAENLRVEHNPKATTASFDLKNRVLTCPVWESMDGDMYDMLLGHEVSHAKNTPWEGWHTTIEGQSKKQASYKHFLNVVEDARIEKLIKRQYPGLRRPFVNAYKALHERDLFQVKGKSTANMYFIDRINLHCKMGFAMNIKFNAVERALLSLVENAETWEDVVAATAKIWEYSKKEQQEDKENQKQRIKDMSESLSGEADEDESEESEDYNSDEDYDYDFDEESEDGDESEESEDSEDGDQSEDGDEGDEDSDSNSDGTEDEEEDKAGESTNKKESEKTESEKENEKKDKSVEADGENKNNSQDLNNDSSDEFVPEAKTDEAFRKNEKLLNAQNAPEVRYVEVPKPNLDRIVTPEKTVNARLSSVFTSPTAGRELLKKFMEKNQTYINSLAKEFEMKKAAKKYVKAKVAESGDINISKLGLYRTEDDIFKRVMTLNQGKNHGLVLLLDKSGSMRNNMSGAIEQILILASFCRKVNIPFVAYGFTCHRDPYNRNMKPHWNFGPRTLKLSSVGLREIINSNMKAMAFTQAMINQLSLSYAYENHDNAKLDQLPEEALQNTPLNEALAALIPMIQTFKTARHLDLVNLIIAHDGDSDYSCNAYNETGTDYYRFDSERERVYLREPVSGAEIMMDPAAGYRGTTVALMELLKKICGIGVYGFFIGTSTTDIRTYYRAEDGSDLNMNSYERRQQVMLEAKELYRKLTREKFLESWTLGYNRFYMLPAGNALKVEDQPIVINGTVTARKLATAFIKQGKAKYSNRVLVSRFIEKIAK